MTSLNKTLHRAIITVALFYVRVCLHSSLNSFFMFYDSISSESSIQCLNVRGTPRPPARKKSPRNPIRSFNDIAKNPPSK